MNDKKAFKILASISIILAMIIIIFNAWVGPSLLPTHKEYKQIFKISNNDSDDNGIKINQFDDEDFDEDVYDKTDDNEDDDYEDDDIDDEDVEIVNINEADEDELMTLPYIGEVLADKIVDYRENYGKFESFEDLLEVDGIGEGILSKIIDYISLD